MNAVDASSKPVRWFCFPTRVRWREPGATSPACYWATMITEATTPTEAASHGPPWAEAGGTPQSYEPAARGQADVSESGERRRQKRATRTMAAETSPGPFKKTPIQVDESGGGSDAIVVSGWVLPEGRSNVRFS